jgi:PAS domain S-box-containing protein
MALRLGGGEIEPMGKLLLFWLIVLSGLALAFGSERGAAPGSDQSYMIRAWNTEAGLPQNSVNAIIQTRDGYLWLGTYGGLTRFDGISFKNFDSANTKAIRSNRIHALYESREGILWIGGEGSGLIQYERGRFTDYSTEGMSGGSPGGFCEDDDGSLWMGWDGRSLVRLKAGQLTTYDESDGLPARITAIQFDRKLKGFWIGTREGLGFWRPGSLTMYTTADGLRNGDIRSLLLSRDGALWVGTAHGLSRLNNGKFTNYTTADGLLSNSILSLFEDRNGAIWVGTIGGGLSRFDRGRFITYTRSDGLPDNTVKCIVEDREGNLWVGTEVGGIARISPRKVSAFGRAQGLPNDSVVPIIEDRQGNIWIGATCGGLVRIKNGQVTIYDARNGLPKECIWSLWADDDGGLWVGTWGGGLAYFKDGKSIVYRYPDGGLSSYTVLAIFRDRKGTLWVGTGNGLNKLKDGKFIAYQTKDGLVHNDVRFITEDRDGALWIGTMGGMSRLKDGKFTNYTVENGLSNNSVRAILQDEEGALWIGTYGGGLNRFKDGKFIHCRATDGLFDDVVSRILDDGRGNFWMSGNRGIFRVSKKELNDFADGKLKMVHSISYGVADGMPTNECNGGAQPAGWKTRDGRLLFPTIKGIAIIDLGGVRTNMVPPPLAIEQVLIDKAPVEARDNIEVPPGDGNLEIHYTALTLSAPEKALFKYKLEGYDKEWVDAGARRAAYYTNLPPGSYTFRVIASNEDGLWNEVGASLQLRLRPHFYQTWWFYVLCAAAAALLGLGCYKLRVRRLVRRTEELEAKVAKRTIELIEQKGNLAQARDQLERANDDMLSILNRLRLGVAMVDRGGFIVFLNRSAHGLLGITEGHAIGRHWEQLFPLEDRDKARLKAMAELAPEARSKIPVHLIGRGGRRYWMEIEVENDPRDPGKKIFFLYDVSEVYDLRSLLDDKTQFQGLVGQSAAMQLIYKQIQDVANLDTTVLIEGETGTGKELVARAIHYSSYRKNKPFITVNAAGLTESILASQLFGHCRGAFTGAVTDHMGLFEAADGGTILLDEIGDIPLSQQASLLRVLQEKEITRLGESKSRKIDVRIIAATNRDLDEAVSAGIFRQDLLYRIRVVRIELPPLRHRREDIPLLVAWFLGQARALSGKNILDMANNCMEALMQHSWPGNVRELKSAIEFAVIRAKGPVLQIEDFPPEIMQSAPANNQSDEKQRILKALERAGGNRTIAARLLGIGRTTLYRRLKALSIEQESKE